MTRKFIIVDTETAPLPTCPADGKAHPEASLVYDLGIMVCDRAGKVYVRKSYIIGEVFHDSDLMNSAYYGAKRPQYEAEIATGAHEVVSFYDAWQAVRDLMREHKVREVWAYNVNFDRRALDNTLRTLSAGWQRFFFPYGVTLRDIWDAAGATICATRKFVAFCRAHGFMTPNGNPKTDAETVYRYLVQDNTLTESHTALADCGWEFQILLRVLRRHPKLPTTRGQGWRAASKIAKANPA